MKAIPLSELYESPTNPRKHFRGLDELAESVQRVGVLSPLLVRAQPREEGGTYEIVFGHRRFRAANKAGLETVPCDVRELTDVDVLEAQLIENVQRDDIHPLEEAEGYDRLMKEAGYSADALATRVGKSRSWVFQRLKLLDLGPEGRKAFLDGKLQFSVAVPLARVPTHKLQAKAVARLTSEEWSVRNALEWLHNEFVISLRNAPFDKKDDMLLENVPSCLKCPKRSGCGTPGVYDDLAGTSGDLCTDTVCYQAKARATWEEKAARHEKAGAEVLTPAEGKRLFSTEGTLKYGTGFVAVDQPVQDDKQRRTWGEILEKAKEQPRLVVAPDAELKPSKLYREEDALAAAASLGFGWAKRQQARVDAAAQASSDEAGGATESTVSEKKLRDIRKTVAREVLVAAGEKIRSSDDVPSMVHVLLARAVDSTRGHEDDTAAAEYLRALKVEKFDEWILRAKPRSILGFVFVALVEEWAGGTWQGFDEGLEATAKAFGLDLKKMVEDATR